MKGFVVKGFQEPIPAWDALNKQGIRRNK